MPIRDIKDIQNLRRAELETWCAEIGEPRFRAQQVLAWVHRKGVATFDDMTDVSKRLRGLLAEHFTRERVAPTFVADACPLCAAGSKPEKPGSRAGR